MIRQLVVFGAEGDLTSRYLLPALAELQQEKRLPEGFQVVGLGRRQWDTRAFRRHARQGLERFASGVPAATRDNLLSTLRYHQADATDPTRIADALGPLPEPIAAYLALPPSVFAGTIRALAQVGLPEGSRVVVEKPFGESLASARELNHLLHQSFPEEAVVRMDHFLGERTFHNILGLRFANRLFEPLWHYHHVERVEIIWDETLTVEGRGSYYDSAGALRDMIQNHLLQLLCLAAMEPPLTFDQRDLRNRKVELLRAVRRLSPEEVGERTVRGRYTAGRIGDRQVVDYADEEGVDPGRGTETFAEVVLTIDNWRWSGVLFRLRSGKALGQDRREISIHFRPVPNPPFGPGVEPRPNVLRLTLDPDRVALRANISGRGHPFGLETVELERSLAPQQLPAYGHLLLDLLEGDPTLSIRDDEAEELWRIAEPILEAWSQGQPPLLEYQAGSTGPRPQG